ncbi:MAG: hypothetical protein ABSB95_10215 [Dissulfurispiraceae bacterium]
MVNTMMTTLTANDAAPVAALITSRQKKKNRLNGMWKNATSGKGPLSLYLINAPTSRIAPVLFIRSGPLSVGLWV